MEKILVAAIDKKNKWIYTVLHFLIPVQNNDSKWSFQIFTDIFVVAHCLGTEQGRNGKEQKSSANIQSALLKYKLQREEIKVNWNGQQCKKTVFFFSKLMICESRIEICLL